MFIDINKVYGFVNKHKHYAGMVELVDTSGLSPVGLVRLGSTPSAGTSDQRSSRRTSKPLLVLLGRAEFEGENPKAFGGAIGSKFQP